MKKDPNKLQKQSDINLIVSILSSINLLLDGQKTLGYILCALSTLQTILFSINKSCDEIKYDEIKFLYEYFIKNYNKLNKIFYLNNPLEVYIMFTYLLNNGYLSKNKNFQYSTKNINDISNLFGVDVINGYGCCRHISSMFCDILNNYGIESYNLCVYLSSGIIYNNSELTKLVIEGNTVTNQLITVINDDVLKKMRANHVITLTIKNNKVYLLDATNNDFYRFNEKDQSILYTYECNKIPIDVEATIWSNQKYVNFKSINQNRIAELLKNKYPNINAEYESNMIKDMIDICDKNLDIFEQFYNENHELYDEISDKVLKYKNKILF